MRKIFYRISPLFHTLNSSYDIKVKCSLVSPYLWEPCRLTLTVGRLERESCVNDATESHFMARRAEDARIYVTSSKAAVTPSLTMTVGQEAAFYGLL